MIEFTDIRKAYGDTTVLGPVSGRIPAGGITSLVGPNGAGKSTLLTIIGRLAEPTSGTVTVDGLDVHRAPSQDVARTLSILRQENHFTARVTVRELVSFGRFPHSRGRLTQEDRAHIDEALDFLHLGDLQHRYLDQLSGGQRQRLCGDGAGPGHPVRTAGRAPQQPGHEALRPDDGAVAAPPTNSARPWS